MQSRRTRKISVNSTKPLISLSRVSRFYKPDKPALFDVSFDIFPGEFVYMAGPSGAGKTTLMRLMHLAEMPDTGALTFAGHDISSLRRSAVSVLRRSMGVVFQDFKLIDDLSIFANVGLPLEVLGLSISAMRSRVEEVLEQVGMPGRGSDLTAFLSGGERQRVAIARALVGSPSLILADEPTGSLDAYSANFVLDILEQVSQSGTTVVFATHDRMLMAARPHRVIAFEGGRLVGMSSTGAEVATGTGT